MISGSTRYDSVTPKGKCGIISNLNKYYEKINLNFYILKSDLIPEFHPIYKLS